MNKNQNDRDERRFSFYSRLFLACVVIATLLVSGLVVRYDRGMVDVVFWVGIGLIVACVVACAWLFVTFIHPLTKEENKK